jgi:diguanylate cyclase (GGDEF)-like protein/PAS domain S-box-containing protein
MKTELESKLERELEYYRNIIEGANLGTWELNVLTGEETINERWAEMIGYTIEELSPVSIDTWISHSHPKDIEEVQKHIDSLFQRRIDHYNVEFRMKHKNGSWVWINGRGKVNTWTEDGRPWMTSGTHTDITSRKLTEEKLQKSEERFRIMFEEAPLGMGLFEFHSGKPYQVNRRFADIIGRTIQECYELDWKAITHPDDIEENLFYREQILAGKTKEFKMRKRYLKPDGSVIWINLIIVLLDAITDPNPRELCMIEDFTERKEWENEILFLNFHDALTGMYNRRFFEEEKNRLDAGRQLPLSIIMADVDGLKLINDGFGYSTGDKLLMEAGEVLLSCCRKEDIASRIGGDEFCILLPGTSQEAAREICKRIQAAAAESIISSGAHRLKCNLSVGSATKTSANEDISKVLSEAEDAMRRSKLLNRNSVRSDLLSSIKATMLEKSHETAEHSERMAAMARAIGEELSLSDNLMYDLELAATLHDIGKVSIDQQILSKSEALTEEEWILMRQHPVVGARIAQATTELMSIAEYILYHHERWDGKGYPQGLKGEEIPLLARIVAVVDAYDAMTEGRPYSEVKSREEAVGIISSAAGTQFDPDIVRIFIRRVGGHEA